MINDSLLFSSGAELKHYNPEDYIFSEGDTPSFLYKIKKGKVKINNYNEAGKEFIQAIRREEQTIGEFSIFTHRIYPMNAVAVEACEIIRLPKNQYLKILENHPENYQELVKFLSEQVHYKSVIMPSMAFHNPSQKLITLMNYIKMVYLEEPEESLQINLTRQQLASLTGLSVETVIRVIKTMERNNLLKIQNRKILY